MKVPGTIAIHAPEYDNALHISKAIHVTDMPPAKHVQGLPKRYIESSEAQLATLF